MSSACKREIGRKLAVRDHTGAFGGSGLLVCSTPLFAERLKTADGEGSTRVSTSRLLVRLSYCQSAYMRVSRMDGAGPRSDLLNETHSTLSRHTAAREISYNTVHTTRPTCK